MINWSHSLASYAILSCWLLSHSFLMGSVIVHTPSSNSMIVLSLELQNPHKSNADLWQSNPVWSFIIPSVLHKLLCLRFGLSHDNFFASSPFSNLFYKTALLSLCELCVVPFRLWVPPIPFLSPHWVDLKTIMSELPCTAFLSSLHTSPAKVI